MVAPSATLPGVDARDPQDRGVPGARSGSGRRRFRLFAGPVDEPRARRVTDVLVVVAALLGLLTVTLVAEPPAGFERSLMQFVAVPGGIDGLWILLVDLLGLGAVVLAVAAAGTRRRWSLLATSCSVLSSPWRSHAEHHRKADRNRIENPDSSDTRMCGRMIGAACMRRVRRKFNRLSSASRTGRSFAWCECKGDEIKCAIQVESGRLLLVSHPEDPVGPGVRQSNPGRDSKINREKRTMPADRKCLLFSV